MKSEREHIEETLEREKLRIPSLGKRIVAYVVDDLLIALALVVFVWNDIAGLEVNSNGIISDGDALMEIILTIVPLNMTCTFLYHWLFIVFYGSTPGKMLCSIRVVDINILDNPSYINAAIRSAIRLLSVMFYYIPFIAIFANPFMRGFHDKLAKSIAIAID